MHLFETATQETVKYENGLTSILIEDRSSLTVAFIVFVKTGPVNEEPHLAGLSHFIEHLMFKGSRNYPCGLISRSIEDMGGYINAATAKEFTMYYVNILKEGAEKSIEMLADTLEFPLFPSDEINRERKVVIEEIQRHRDDPVAVLYEKFYEAVYAENALRNSIIGTPETIADISREQICGYYKTYYVPEKIIVAASGNFDKRAVNRLIGGTFGKFENHAPPPSLPPAEKTRYSRNTAGYGKVELGYMLTGFLGPKTDEEYIYVADLAACILGGAKSSRLYKTLYEKRHIVYSIDAFFVNEMGGGNLCIASVFDPKNFKEVRNGIREQIECLIDGNVAEEEIRRAKLLMKTNWNFSLETPFDIADKYGYWRLAGNPEFAREYVNRVENATADDIIGFFKKYYLPETVSESVLLPETTVAA
jgi:zinc protease